VTRVLGLVLAAGVAIAAPAPVVAASPPASSPASSARQSPATLVVPAASTGLPGTWRQRFVVRYGPGRSHLGTAPGGDSGSLLLGPEYGAPAPDGSWWFLDAAKRRLARFSASGRYLGQVRIPRSMLVGGRYFQWQLPHVLADGTLVAVRQAPDGSFLLRLRDGVLDEVRASGSFFPTYDDGRVLYGFSTRGRLVSVDPGTGHVSRVTSLRTPSGTPFTITLGRRLEVGLPGSTLTRRLATASGARAHVSLQVRAGADDSLQLYLVGAGADHPRRQLVGATRIGPSGTLAPVEALPDPFSDADPGSPAQLAMAPGSSTPMLVYVLTDGVHVYERSG
jgi:hypothetical protein